MFPKIIIYLLLTNLVFPISSFAFKIEEIPDEEFKPEIKPLQVTGNALNWEIFAKTKEEMKCVTLADGFDDCHVKPIYSNQIKALKNKTVTLMGFMFPLDTTDKQKNFLIGPYPASCPFHYHVSPAQIVEVRLKKPIEFSYEPVTVKGVLSLKFNKETGIFYYLEQI